MMLRYFRDDTLRLVHSLLLLAGVVLVLWSIILTRNTKPKTEYFHSTVGIARRVEQIAPTQFQIKTEYTLPGGSTASAEAIFREHAPPKQGEKILVHYNPYAPGEIEAAPLPPVQPQFVFFLSILIGGLGFRFFIRYTFRNAKMRVIAEHGKKITPVEVLFEEEFLKILYFIRIPVMRLHCRWTGFSGREHLDFFSDHLPPGRRDEIDPSRVRVYYLPQDPRRYFLELDETSASEDAG